MHDSLGRRGGSSLTPTSTGSRALGTARSRQTWKFCERTVPDSGRQELADVDLLGIGRPVVDPGHEGRGGGLAAEPLGVILGQVGPELRRQVGGEARSRPGAEPALVHALPRVLAGLQHVLAEVLLEQGSSGCAPVRPPSCCAPDPDPGLRGSEVRTPRDCL